MGLEHEEPSGSVIGAAIEVHKALGPGFLESVYENALVLELAARGIGCERQLAAVRSYLRASGRGHGLILNFAKQALEIKRVIASQRLCHGFLASWLP